MDLEISKHLSYIISLYTSFGPHLSEEEYTQFGRNTCCYSSSIHHFFFFSTSTVAESTELRQRCITLISAPQGNSSFCLKGGSAAGRSLLLGIPGRSEAAMPLAGMLWYPAGVAVSPGSWSILSARAESALAAQPSSCDLLATATRTANPAANPPLHLMKILQLTGLCKARNTLRGVSTNPAQWPVNRACSYRTTEHNFCT